MQITPELRSYELHLLHLALSLKIKSEPSQQIFFAFSYGCPDIPIRQHLKYC